MKTILTPREIVESLQALHAEMVNNHEDLLLWMPISIEDMADLVIVAITLNGTEE